MKRDNLRAARLLNENGPPHFKSSGYAATDVHMLAAEYIDIEHVIVYLAEKYGVPVEKIENRIRRARRREVARILKAVDHG